MTLKTLTGLVFCAILATWSISSSIAFSAPGAEAVASSTPTPSPTAKTADQTYTVVAGDNYWLIAQKVYGNGSKYPLILSANKITETTKLRVGQILVVPALDSPSAPNATPVPVATPSVQAPTAVPTLAQPTPTRGAQPTASVNPVALRSNPTVPPGTSSQSSAVSPSSSGDLRSLVASVATPDFVRVLDILSGILAGSSVVVAFFAYQAYVRAQRLQRMTRVRRRSRVHVWMPSAPPETLTSAHRVRSERVRPIRGIIK